MSLRSKLFAIGIRLQTSGAHNATTVLCQRSTVLGSIGSRRSKTDQSMFGKIGSTLSSSDYEQEKKRQENQQQQFQQLLNDDDIFQGPLKRDRYGLLKAIVVIAAGIYCGALFAAVGANMLEELEIFVRDDDDDDD